MTTKLSNTEAELRELLILAAKAAGIEITTWSNCQAGGFLKGGEGRFWNPATDDGDSRRLGVALKIHHRQYSSSATIRGCRCRGGYVEAVRNDIEEREPVNGDPCAATRLAVLRAAAEVGRRME